MIRYVLFCRRRNHYANKVMAAMQGDHGRAIQEVCEHLSDEAWVSDVIKRHLKCASASELPIQLQIVFKVRLVRDGAVSIATDAGYVDSRLYDMLNPTR